MNNENIGSLSNSDIEKIHNDYSTHIADGKVINHHGLIVCLDFLGWKENASKESIALYFKLINRLRNKILDTILRCTNGKERNVIISTLSDTIVVLVDGDYPFAYFNMFGILSGFITDALKNGFALRGAMSFGDFFTNALNNVFVGKPFYESVKYCESTNWAGVIIAPSLKAALLENNSIKDLEQLGIIQYKQIPFKNKFKNSKIDLVIMPRNEIWYNSRGEIQPLDIKSLYSTAINGDNKDVKLKLKHTLDFIDYLYSNVWK